MSGTIHYLDNEALRKEVRQAILDLSSMVSVTLGPGGRPVLLEQGNNQSPLSTKDGVTVARYFSGTSNIARVVADAAREVCERTARIAGDGPVPLYSKVLTPKGFIEMRDVKVGMEICGTNGTVQKVLGIFPKGQKEIYEIEIGNRGTVECCSDHLWGVINSNNEGSYQVTPASGLMTDYVKEQNDGSLRHKYFIPKTHVFFQENTTEMPLDPYLVGALLGDGSLKDSGSIELSLGIKKKHVIDKLRLPDGMSINVQFVENKNYFRVKLSGFDKNGKTIRNHIQSLGLRDSGSFSKFIPKSYLYSSVEAREQLLQGLLDTDGHITEKGLFEFSTVSKELADDFVSLVSSLGKTVFRYLKTRSKEDGCYSDSPIYRISELKGYKHGHVISKITPTGRYTEMQCIKVSNPNSLYIMDNYVVTHNTTTAIVLASALVKEGQEYIVNHPSDSPQKLSRDLRNIFLNKIKPEILALSKSIKGLNPEESIAAITHVAKVSANHDSEIAEKVAEGVSKVGENGMVIAEEGAGAETTLVINKGFPINSGLKDLGGAASTIFVNGNHGDCKIEGGVYVVLYDGEIRDADTITPLLEAVNSEVDHRGHPLRTPVIIFAHGYSDLVLKSLGQNFRQNRFTCIPLVTPRNGQDHYRQSFLHDLSAYVGGVVFDPHSNNLKDVELGQLGAANSIKAGQNEIVIMATPDIDVLEARIEELKSQQERASDFDADRIRYRLGQLTGGVATIFAGGVTAFEAKERHARVVDAISAVRSAIDMGVVPGGGSTLLHVASKLSDTGPESIFKKALTVPFSTIVMNAGGYYDKSMEKIGPNEDGGFMVYDALNMKLVDWWESGILDPVKVTLTALENALSVAQLLMTLGGLIAVSNSEEENKIKMMQQGMIRAMNQEV